MYDKRGKLLSSIDPEGNSWNYKYDIYGNCILVKDPEGREWQHKYNELGQIIVSISPDGSIKEYGYTNHGLLAWEKSTPGIKVEFNYDHLNRLIERHAFNNGEKLSRKWSYHLHYPQPVSVIYEDGLEQFFEYDKEALCVRVVCASLEKRIKGDRELQWLKDIQKNLKKQQLEKCYLQSLHQ